MPIFTGELNESVAEDDMLGNFSIAVEAALEYIHDIGGQPSPGKTALLASASTHRKHLRKTKWGASACTILVQRNVRDLGAHITFSGAPSGVTINQRADKASLIMDRMKLLPAPASQRGRLIVGKGYAM